MKVISLNLWNGRAGKQGLLDFFNRNKDVDIFCLQEVWEGGHEHAPRWGGNITTSLITEIQNILDEHTVFFRPHYMEWYGLAVFAKREMDIKKEADVFVFKERKNIFEDSSENHARNIQYITVETDKGMRTIINFHGLWNGQGKEDNEERLLQSENILKFIKTIDHPYILCGDFNLLPHTESLKKFENHGLRNLIKEYGITSTRTSLYEKPARFADYAFVSEGITVHDFKVLSDEVSDHSPLYLDFW
jgi:endonuclease/exonuclease/phosphatase family metal-dependent hydrolase